MDYILIYLHNLIYKWDVCGLGLDELSLGRCTIHGGIGLKGKRITLEHTLRHHFRTQPFCITLEHKIKHLMETPTYTHTSDLLTGARLWKKNAFQSETNTKKLLVWEFDSFQPCHTVPRLPRKRTVDVQKCHTCHAKWRSMSKGPTPATANEGEYMKQKPCCTWCKKSNETFTIYMLLHLM